MSIKLGTIDIAGVPTTALNTIGTHTTQIASLTSNKADKTDVDGQWIASTLDIGSINLNGSTSMTFDLSSYLPNDSYIYEVCVFNDSVTGATSGNYITVKVSNGDGSFSRTTCRIITRTNSTMYAGGCATVPIGTDRIISFPRTTNWNGSAHWYATGYRRLGKNQ